jgi:hypothetical protein
MTKHTQDATRSHLTSSTKSSRFLVGALSLTLLPILTVSGCHKTVDDATLGTNIKSALAGDPSISQQPIQVAVQSGVATLTGNVSDDTARSVSAQDAARVPGVKEIVNNLTVAGIAVAPTITSPSAPTYSRPTTREERREITNRGTLPPPSANAPVPAPPVSRNITLPSGTEIPIRITQTLDSQTTQTGEPFSGVVTREVVADGLVAIPAGSAVSGTVDEAKDATHFKGSSILSIELTSLRRRGNTIPISTDPYTVDGKGRGMNSVEKIGGGAAIGAVLGGIFGGGKGAAIGAAAGGGGGAAVQGFTRGQQVQIPSETVIRFRLSNPITLSASEAPSGDQQSTGLRTRQPQPEPQPQP